MTREDAPVRRAPGHLWIGLGLVALCWPLNWVLPGMRTHLLFFPLWLGYALAVDGLRVVRAGDSILTRTPLLYGALFLLSVPVWWLFEVLNWRLGNWEYLGRRQFGDLEYVLLSSLSFSTVMPAVLGTAELVRTSRWIERFASGPVLRPSGGLCLGLFVAGLAMLALMLAWPRWFYPFAWTSLVFLCEPLAVALRRRSLLTELARGDWRPWVALWTGGLVCGFFWELWNLHSYPKWIYHVPGVGFWKVFEMPLLGYLGYLPFAMELYLAAQLVLPKARKLRL